MRMKEDHMRNGQLKPGYNIQVGTESGFVTTYGIYSNPTDTRTLQPVLEQFYRDYSRYPENLIADKGYGSIENYVDCEKKKIAAYIKYQHWEMEKKKRSKKYRYRWWNFRYDKRGDHFTCPEGNTLRYERNKTRIRYDSTEELLRVYVCSDSPNCHAHNQCTRSSNRRLEFNQNRYRLQQRARERLKTEKGWQFYRRRGTEVETVFGQVKGNWGFRRFNGWGNRNAACEWGLLMMAYNLKKIAITLSP